MKFLANVNVPRPIITRLRADGHEVVWVTDRNRELSDYSVVRLAERERALILTEDRDYKRMVLEEQQATYGVVWLRLAKMPFTQHADRTSAAIRVLQSRLLRQFTTIYPDRVEQEPLPNPLTDLR